MIKTEANNWSMFPDGYPTNYWTQFHAVSLRCPVVTGGNILAGSLFAC